MPPVVSPRPATDAAAPAAPSAERVEAFAAALRPRLDGDLRTDAVSRALYATDASMYQVMPVAVLVPTTRADVQKAVELAGAWGLPVLARGGGSSLAGQGVNAALVIDFTKHLNRILDLDAEAQTATVEPGLVLDELNAAAAPYGLMVGPDPASSSRATLGGMLANNSTGTHSIRYGNLVHHVERVEAILADGSAATFEALDRKGWQQKLRAQGLEGDIYRGMEALLARHTATIERDMPAHWRRNQGYRLEHLTDPAQRNLAHVVCGSEGTLALATEMTIRLVERPRRTALGMAHFATRDEALRAVETVLETDPAACELFDGVAIARARATPGFADRLTYVEGDPGGILLTEYFGDTEDELAAKLDALDATLSDAETGYTTVRLTDPDAIKSAWTVRKESLGLIMGEKGDYKPWAFIEDASVPVRHLPAYIDELSDLIDATGTKAVYYAHASAGCLHVRAFIDTKTEDGVATMEHIAEGSAQLVKKYGGLVSSEHGDGLVRAWLSPLILGDALYQVCRETKQIFDPNNRLNPHRVVDAPPMTDHLRMGPGYATRDVETVFDYGADGGYAGAIELCNGNGACRKLHAGTMCPSFMVTREEEDSTRGRANALRTALAGDLPAEAYTGERMAEVMDLCIQCKACKTECPSSVDMAKIKTEWLGHYWKEHRMPLRTRLFAHQPTLAGLIAGTPLAPLVNRVNAAGPVRWMMEKTLGISAERDLPPFARRTFDQWSARRDWIHAGATPPPTDAPPVVLFTDTFNNAHTPGVAQAAAEVLRATGHAVVVPDQRVCCGRTLLSKGLVERAKATARHAIDALYPYAAQGWPIAGLEPSCLLTLQDEFLSLWPGDAKAEAVADAAVLVETLIADRFDAGTLPTVPWPTVPVGGDGYAGPPDPPRAVLHGHCHQKALVGTGGTERALRLAGYAVDTLDAGCCGMAGAFGYEAEHLAVSKQMAERVLAPACRAAGADDVLAAPGFSCRSQIKDTADRTAHHPVELMRQAL